MTCQEQNRISFKLLQEGFFSFILLYPMENEQAGFVRYKTFEVIFRNNEIASIKQVKHPKIGFGGNKYVSCTPLHLIFAYIKAMSITKAMKEAQKIIEEFLKREQ